MKSGYLRRVAFALGMGACAAVAPGVFAEAPYASHRRSYQAPAKWNTFQRPSARLGTAVDARQANRSFGASIQSAAAYQDGVRGETEQLPVPPAERSPVSSPKSDPLAIPTPPQPVYDSVQAHDTGAYSTLHDHGYSSSIGCASGGCESPFAAAVGAPCGSRGCAPCATPSPRPIAPWFGGANLLFWNLDCGPDHILITDDSAMPLLSAGDIAPDNQVGFDAHVGRYFGCGMYGLDFGYLLWDPDAETRILANMGNGYRVTLPALTTVSINRGAGATTVYDDYDMNASRLRVIRDLRVQGFEANLVCFGLMGARRLGSCNPSPLFGYGHCGNGFYGGATGPLSRAAGGRVRVQTSHGFRWFQLEDELQISGDVDGTTGYQPSDLHYLIDTENNLFGYQFGSRLTYCLGCRTMLSLGGKIGVYGNDASVSHRITTDTAMAYTNTQGAGPGDICTEESDVGVAGLGELDFGIGYRLNNRWTINGGYRLLSACGVATTIGQIPVEYVTAASAGAVRADDCLFLHGAYVGVNCNW